MNSIIIYAVDSLDYGDSDDRSGWYLIRLTVTVVGGKAKSIVNRQPIAQFVAEGPNSTTMEAMNIHDAIEAGEFVLMPKGWDFNTLNKVIADRGRR